MNNNKFKYFYGNYKGVFELQEVTFQDFKSEFYNNSGLFGGVISCVSCDLTLQ